jgi:hypothetical protein
MYVPSSAHDYARLRKVAVVGIFTALAFFSIANALFGGVTPSVELTFSELSPAGFEIVPASCPSDPHFSNECSVQACPTGETFNGTVCICNSTGQEPVQGVCPVSQPSTGCTITATPSSIATGDPVTLAWNTSPGATGNPTLSPSIGTVGRSGTYLAYPSVTTTYTLSGTQTINSVTSAYSCTVTASVNTADNSQCISHTIPATMNPGETRSVSVTFKNTGTNTWVGGTYWSYLTAATHSSHLSPVTKGIASTVQCSGPEGGCETYPGYVYQNQNYTFTFNLTAPTTPGIYGGLYRMYHNGVSLFGATCGQPSVTVGTVCAPTYFCSGSNLMYRAVSCAETISQACAYGCDVAFAQCSAPPVPSVSITAAPQLVRSGNTTAISWTSTNTASCSVSEDNPDITNAWTGTSGTQTSSAITSRTVYNLVCTGLDGSQASDSVTVNVLPKWREI